MTILMVIVAYFLIGLLVVLVGIRLRELTPDSEMVGGFIFAWPLFAGLYLAYAIGISVYRLLVWYQPKDAEEGDCDE